MVVKIEIDEAKMFEIGNARLRSGSSPLEIDAHLDAFQVEFGHRPNIVYACGTSIAIPLTDEDCATMNKMELTQ